MELVWRENFRRGSNENFVAVVTQFLSEPQHRCRLIPAPVKEIIAQRWKSSASFRCMVL
jgi:hypothetical protein